MRGRSSRVTGRIVSSCMWWPPAVPRLKGNARCRVESSGEFAFCNVGECDQLDAVASNRVAHACARENLNLSLRLGRGRDTADIGRGMEIELGGAFANS